MSDQKNTVQRVKDKLDSQVPKNQREMGVEFRYWNEEGWHGIELVKIVDNGIEALVVDLFSTRKEEINPEFDELYQFCLGRIRSERGVLNSICKKVADSDD